LPASTGKKPNGAFRFTLLILTVKLKALPQG
jgi:hypothetical protein